MDTTDRIRKFQAFAGRWLQYASLFGILLLVTAGWNWYFARPAIPDTLANVLWIPIAGFSWTLIDVARLRKAHLSEDFRKELMQARKNLYIRRIAWGSLFIIGLGTAVFASLFAWDEAFLFAGIGLCLPAGIYFLAELGLGLQADWIWHALNRDE